MINQQHNFNFLFSCIGFIDNEINKTNKFFIQNLAVLLN